MANFVGRKK